MKNVLIRDLDDAVVESFKNEAKRRGTSLQAVLKQVVESNAPQNHDASFWAELRRSRLDTGPATNIARDLLDQGRAQLDEKMTRYSS
jgi:hypothetical protein